jgi:DNA-directed RNA polymerase subunit RPC12/RpoP
MVFMSVVEFVCPHCNERFEFENPPAGEHVACPLCGGMLAIPAELPTEDTAAGDFDFVGRDDGETAAGAFDVGELAPTEMLPHRRKSAAVEKLPAVVPLSREEKERRRQIRTVAWMIGGGLLLAIAAAVLSRL